MWRVLQLKLLDVLRNPYNRSSLFVHHLHQVLSRHLPQISSEFTALIAARADEDVAPILQTFGFTFDEYTAWLANLYGMLSEGVHHSPKRITLRRTRSPFTRIASTPTKVSDRPMPSGVHS